MQKSITELRKFLLPQKFKDTGLYSERVHQRTAAFRLLVHAEFESFVEDIVTDHLSSKVEEWKKFKSPSITIAAILAYQEGVGREPGSILNPGQRGPDVDFIERLSSAVQKFQRKVRTSNHGIREKNILSMTLPIGLDPKCFDQQWLADLDSWASERGELAHQSVGKVNLRLDPEREYKKVKNLLIGFKDLDRQIALLP